MARSGIRVRAGRDEYLVAGDGDLDGQVASTRCAVPSWSRARHTPRCRRRPRRRNRRAARPRARSPCRHRSATANASAVRHATQAQAHHVDRSGEPGGGPARPTRCLRRHAKPGRPDNVDHIGPPIRRIRCRQMIVRHVDGRGGLLRDRLLRVVGFQLGLIVASDGAEASGPALGHHNN
jgi:hypothetical protein